MKLSNIENKIRIKFYNIKSEIKINFLTQIVNKIKIL